MSNARNIASGAKFVDTAGDTMSGGLNVTGADVTITGSTNTDATLNVLSPNWVTGAYADINIAHQPTSRKIRGHYDNGIEIFTNNANAALKVDPSGRVTLPYQPYFYAGSTYSGTLISSALMPFDTAAVNRGNHYNTSTYLFTAPISGQYLFTVNALNYPNSTTGQLYFSVNNGGFTALVRNNSIVSQQSIAGSAILNLAANDTVGVIGQLYFYASGGHGHFSGILLG